MKLIILALALVSVQSASAAVLTRDAAVTTCADLQSTLNKEGSLFIARGGSWGNLYSVNPTCNFNEHAVSAYVRASDKFCLVGYVCEFAGN